MQVAISFNDITIQHFFIEQNQLPQIQYRRVQFKFHLFFLHLIVIEVSISQDGKRFRVTVGSTVHCTCTPSQRADRKTCSHSVWVLMNLFKVEEDDDTLAQINLDMVKVRALSSACPSEIPPTLSKCLVKIIQRNFHPRIMIHASRDAAQVWRLERKSGKKSMCSSCLKRNILTSGMVHAVVDGLLYVAKNDAVYETTLRFCAKAKCVTDIRSKMNNIRNLASMEVPVDGSLILTEEERADLMQEGFVLLDV